MKNKMRKICSLLAASTILTSAFSVTSFAAESSSTQTTNSSRVTLLAEDFSNFQQGDNWCDRTKMWRVENEGSGDVFGTYVTVVDTAADGKMTNALKLSKDAPDKMRGGRSWTSDKYVMPGETLTFEVDIYADNVEATPKFAFGLVSEYGAAVPDEYGMTNSLFVVWDGKFQIPKTQKRYSYSQQDTGIAFKKGEVNHVKVDYTINDNISQGEWGQATDKETITVTTSEGTKQFTYNVPHRFKDEDSKLTSAAGIGYIMRTHEEACKADIYIDNIKVYQDKTYQNGNYSLIKDNFDSLNNSSDWNGSDWNDNNRVDKWRIEGGSGDNGWNSDLTAEEMSVVDFGGKTNVLKLANQSNIIRGGRGWSLDSAEFIKPGESFSMEFDIYAEAKSRISLGIVGQYNKSDGTDENRCEDAGGMGGLFIIRHDDYADKVYFSNTQELAFHNARELTGITTFKSNEFNHVKIDYTLNKDVSADTLDKITMTVTNSAGKTSSQTVDTVKFRYSGDKNPITQVRGINFIKHEADSTIYLDNIEFYKTGVTLPKTTVNADKTYYDIESSVSVTFSEPMNEASLENVMVIADAKKAASVMPLTTTKTLSEDKKTYTLTGNFVKGTAYQLVIPASVKAENGIKLTEGEIHNFTAKEAPTRAALTDAYSDSNYVTVNITANSQDVGKNVYVIIAKYGADGRFEKAQMSGVTTLLEGVTEVPFNLGGSEDNAALRKGWKAFVWTTDAYSPLCIPVTN